jgi:hypothetical protein
MGIKWKISVVILAGLVGGCNPEPQQLIIRVPTVPILDDSAYVCPTLDTLPNPSTLTTIEVAGVLKTLDQNNMICKNTVESTKQFYKDEKAKIEKK